MSATSCSSRALATWSGTGETAALPAPSRRRRVLRRQTAVRYHPTTCRSRDEGRAQAAAARRSLRRGAASTASSTSGSPANGGDGPDRRARAPRSRTGPISARSAAGSCPRSRPTSSRKRSFTPSRRRSGREAISRRRDDRRPLRPRPARTSTDSSPIDDWDTALAVLHGAVNRAILSYALTGERMFLGHFEQAAGCINVLDVGDHWIVRAVNVKLD